MLLSSVKVRISYKLVDYHKISRSRSTSIARCNLLYSALVKWSHGSVWSTFMLTPEPVRLANYDGVPIHCTVIRWDISIRHRKSSHYGTVKVSVLHSLLIMCGSTLST
jgi:hypothetical protein